MDYTEDLDSYLLARFYNFWQLDSMTEKSFRCLLTKATSVKNMQLFYVFVILTYSKTLKKINCGVMLGIICFQSAIICIFAIQVELNFSNNLPVGQVITNHLPGEISTCPKQRATALFDVV